MPARTKRFGLIPLGKIDKENVNADWPVYDAYLGAYIEWRADGLERQLRGVPGCQVPVDGSSRLLLPWRFSAREIDGRASLQQVAETRVA